MTEIRDDIRLCLRCRFWLVDEDDAGWYYQQPVSHPDAPGLTFMDRVHECGGEPHEVVCVTREDVPSLKKAVDQAADIIARKDRDLDDLRRENEHIRNQLAALEGVTPC